MGTSSTRVKGLVRLLAAGGLRVREGKGVGHSLPLVRGRGSALASWVPARQVFVLRFVSSCGERGRVGLQCVWDGGLG